MQKDQENNIAVQFFSSLSVDGSRELCGSVMNTLTNWVVKSYNLMEKSQNTLFEAAYHD